MRVSGYEELIQKLDEFIRKYYKNQMIKGALYCVALIVGSYLLVALLEYFGRFSILMRTILFYSFIIGVLAVIVKFFMIPLTKMFRLGKTISHETAAEIIGVHFAEVQDKLLNTLQLKTLAEQDSDNSLLKAGIEQKIAALKPVPFSSAIDLRQNRKYLTYAIPPIAVVLILLFAAPSILTKPTERLIKHGQIVLEEAPFKIQLLNESLRLPENADITIDILVKGNEIPDKVYVVVEDQQFMLEKKDNLHFSYTFKNVRENQEFNFYASGFYSETYELEVMPVPALADFKASLKYPAYTKRVNEEVKNTGDLTVPVGTKISWEFLTKNTNKLSIKYGDSTYVMQNEDDLFSFSKTAMSNTSYIIHAANGYISGSDSIAYNIQVIPDLFPAISVEEERDSTSLLSMFFTGEVKDDYGFKRLSFNYQVQNGDNSEAWKAVDIPVSRDQSMDNFFFNWNMQELGISSGSKITYYFEIWDNDGVNGSKASKSAIREYAIPTEEELEALVEQKNEDIKSKLEDSLKDAKKLEKELEELRKQMLDKKEMNWQDKKKMEDLLKKQQELQKQIQDVQKQNEQKNNQQNELQQQNENILEKQQQLEKLMEEILTPEMEEMMKELQKMMDELNKDKLQEELKKMDLSTEDMEKELDRALEQFKQLEFETKMEKTVEKLEKLAEKQEELSKESEKKDANSEELKQKQEELNKEFENIQKEKDELEKLNEELEDPNKMPDTEQQEQEIKEEQKDSKEQLEKNKKSGASKSQKSAADKMKQMAAQMDMANKGGEQEKQEEDMEALRALLENIITLSFDQEAVMSSFKTIDMRDPNYNKLGQIQRKLKDDARMVEDSLFALSKRVPEISAAVNREINQVNDNMDLALSNIPDRKTPEVTTAQQYVMTSFNNLALMLDEALKQMQQKNSQSKPGQGNCEKPGGNGKKPKPSAGDIKKMQESLSKQLEEMKKKGQNKGDNKGGQGMMSKQLAEMAAKQAALRKMMEEKGAELNEDGSGNGNEMKQIAKEMEQLQKDIVNDKIDENTIRRQQDIMIRLLKAEEAERIRDQDNQRKSNEAKDFPIGNPQKYEEYIRKKQQETELLRTVPPTLKPYYRDKVNEYFNKIGKE
ncbi:MAG: DUF4175 family protein [Flavobacteriales bacterium]